MKKRVNIGLSRVKLGKFVNLTFILTKGKTKCWGIFKKIIWNALMLCSKIIKLSKILRGLGDNGNYPPLPTPLHSVFWENYCQVLKKCLWISWRIVILKYFQKGFLWKSHFSWFCLHLPWCLQPGRIPLISRQKEHRWTSLHFCSTSVSHK